MTNLKNKKVLLTGGNGFLGDYVLKKLIKRGIKKENIFIPRSKEYDLRERNVCKKLIFGKNIVIHLAATVGGIGFNQRNPATAFYDNASMALNLIDVSFKEGVEKFIGIGSVCSYPKNSPTPFLEKNLWDGYPEETNAFYGLAKKLMLVQSQAYYNQYKFNAIHLLMVNLYGPRDHFDLQNSHVIPALIRKIIEAKKDKIPLIEIWGSGKATREFLYVEDAAEAIILAAEKYNKPEPVNIGSGMEISIKNLVNLICKLINYGGQIKWNKSKPDGQLKRLLDTKKAFEKFGFKAKVNLKTGLNNTIKWYKDSV